MKKLFPLCIWLVFWTASCLGISETITKHNCEKYFDINDAVVCIQRMNTLQSGGAAGK
jgi:hypothetical protein